MDVPMPVDNPPIQAPPPGETAGPWNLEVPHDFITMYSDYTVDRKRTQLLFNRLTQEVVPLPMVDGNNQAEHGNHRQT